MKHQCAQDRYVSGLGWKCLTCDPNTVKQQEQMRIAVDARYAAENALWQDEYRYCLRKGYSEVVARNSANSLFE